MTFNFFRTNAALALLVLFFSPGGFAQAVYQPPVTERAQTLLAEHWKFQGYAKNPAGVEKPGFDDAKWQSVAVPHTWDSRTDLRTHKAAWYRTHFALASADRGKEIFLYFEGAATVARVYLNGVLLGEHRGAYTRFIFDATKAAKYGGDNVLAVSVDNDPKDTADCLPAGNGIQLYHIYGGLYRKVWLLKTAPFHVDPMDYASSGVYLTPQNVSAESADLGIKTLARNDGAAPVKATVTNQVCDRDNHVIATVAGDLILGPHQGQAIVERVQLTQPHLWSPQDPYLYHVYTEVSIGGTVTDMVAERTGFRFFTMTPDEFNLNGQSLPLRGVAKHQETEERATAVSDDDLRADWERLQDLGVNFVRLAHYPHAPLEYDQADERGLIVWAENGHSNPAPATKTGDQITREMVRQNYNHPSIVFWSAGNEAIFKNGDIAAVEHYAKLIRAEDPSRLITYASHSRFAFSPFLDFVAHNRYTGWYYGYNWDFQLFAAKYHWISETGAGGVISNHWEDLMMRPYINLFEPEEYQQLVAEARCQIVFRDQRNVVPLFTWWTFRDFDDPRYKGYNTKGLQTAGGFRKDSYYLFQAFLKPKTPVVHLCGKTWFLRRGSGGIEVKAYGNVPQLTLSVNGRIVGTQPNGVYVQPGNHFVDNVFDWDAALQPGKNTVSIDDGHGHTDSMVLTLASANPPNDALVQVTSSNTSNPAYFIDTPIQAEWPFYTDFDGTGDNTFYEIPAILEGARWIATGRISKTRNGTDLTLTVPVQSGPVDVFVMLTAGTMPPAFVTDAGFVDTGISGLWRNNFLTLVPYALYRKTLAGGETAQIRGDGRDFVVLVKRPQIAP